MHNSGLRCRVSALPILVVYLIVALTCAARGASQDDPYYAKDLLAARSDEHYKNLSDLEAVRIYRLHRESALFRECDRRYVGALDCTITEITALEMAKAAKAANKSVNAQTAASTPPSMAINAGVAKVASTAALGAGSDAAAAKTTASPTANSSQIIPFIRHDFPDISLFAALTPAGNATGAQLSYSSDRAGNNDFMVAIWRWGRGLPTFRRIPLARSNDASRSLYRPLRIHQLAIQFKCVPKIEAIGLNKFWRKNGIGCR